MTDIYLFHPCCGFRTRQFQGSRLPIEKKHHLSVMSRKKKCIERTSHFKIKIPKCKIQLTTLVLSVSLKYVSGFSLPTNLNEIEESHFFIHGKN